MRTAFELPPVFGTSDKASLTAQRAYIRSTRVQLVLLVFASAAGAFTWTWGARDLTALIAGVAFAAAAALRLVMLRSRPHLRWYSGRAAAESIKTLAWRYAVGGHPFGVELGADRGPTFAEKVSEMAHEIGVDPAPSAAAPTPSMESLRGTSLTERKQAYERDRIVDQQEWYSAKSSWNRRRARFWGLVVLLLQVAAAAGAFLKGFSVVAIDVFGLAGAVVASAAAWLETKQHANLASAYRLAAEELESIQGLIAKARTEGEWAVLVANSEGAISREHTMWKASSRDRQPAGLT